MSRYERPPDESRWIQAVYYLYAALSRLALALPERVAYGLAHVAGWIAARTSKKREQVERNLSTITGHHRGTRELEELVVAAYRSYARYWLETFRLVREDRDFFLDRFRSPTQERVFGVSRTGTGVLVVVGHLGNWDAAGAWVGANGFRVATVAEVLKPRRMFDFFVEHRNRLGMTIYPAERGVTERLKEELRAGAVVAILGDRDLKGTGPKVTFFGREATFPAGAASIALDLRVPVLVAGVYGVVHEDGKRGWRADISEPLELPEGDGPEQVAELTQRIATSLEEAVARHPEEWHAVLQRFWTEDRATKGEASNG